MKILVVSFITIILFSCVKDPVTPEPDPTPTPASPTPDSRTYNQRLADSLYKYAQQIYYWNNQLTDSVTFKPLGYVSSDTLTGIKNELLAITRIVINPATGKPYEQYTSYQNGMNTDVNTTSKFSYAVLTSDLYGGGSTANIIADQKRVSELKMTLDGKENELGFTIGFARLSYLAGTSKAMPLSPQDSVIGLVRVVTKGSPAWNAGVRRGDLISKFNGNTWTYSNNLTQISNALDASALTLTTYNPANKQERTATFNKEVYTYNPVYRDTMITVGSKKIAYIAYKSFTIDDNTQPALRAAFDKFTGATDLVIDLRYNGGGYVSSAEFFANCILPSSASGVLFKEIYNTTMQNRQATILRNQPVYLNNIKQNYTYFDIDYSVAGNTKMVKKEGSFNANGAIANLYFIVSDNTASASELLINCLKPYFNNQVYLINAPFATNDNPDYTYGKPIGFFEIRLGKYSVYMSNFESKNKNDEGGYYNGIKTDLRSSDDIRYDLGDPNETSFLAAIRRITGNAAYQPTSSTTTRSVYSTINSIVAAVGEPTKIHGMIEIPGRN